MVQSLEIVKSRRHEKDNRPYSLRLRIYDGVETNYVTIADISDELAENIVEAGKVQWGYGLPDPQERFKARTLEKARLLEEEAKALRASIGMKEE